MKSESSKTASYETSSTQAESENSVLEHAALGKKRQDVNEANESAHAADGQVRGTLEASKHRVRAVSSGSVDSESVGRVGNPSLAGFASAFPPEPHEMDFKDNVVDDLSEDEAASLDAQAELMSHMYGLDTESKSNEEVLALIQMMGNGPARDHALNSYISLQELDALIEEEKKRLAEKKLLKQKSQTQNNEGPSIVVTDSDDALAINLPNANSKILDSVHAVNAINAFNSALQSERGHVSLGETTDLGKSLASQSMLGASNSLKPNTLGSSFGSGGNRSLDLGNDFSVKDAEGGESALANLGVADAYMLGSTQGVNGQYDNSSSQVPQGIDFPNGYPVAIPKLKALIEIGMTVEMVQQYLHDHHIWDLQLSELRQLLEVDLSDLRAFLCSRLDPCYPVIYIDTLNIRMLTKLNLVVEHPFYVVMGLNLDGDRKLLSTGAFPKEYATAEAQSNMWRNVLQDMKARGLVDPIFMVTANVEHFKEILHEVFPKGIFQISIDEICRRAQKNMDTMERKRFESDFKSLYNCKSLLECMKALDRLSDPWKTHFPESIQIIKDNFLFFEQYFAANPALRVSLRSTKAIDSVAKDLRRDMREDTEFRYQDALHAMCRIIEIDRYVTRNARPVQWKRALKSMLDDLYTGTILSNYLDAGKIKLPRRN